MKKTFKLVNVAGFDAGKITIDTPRGIERWPSLIINGYASNTKMPATELEDLARSILYFMDKKRNQSKKKK